MTEQAGNQQGSAPWMLRDINKYVMDHSALFPDGFREFYEEKGDKLVFYSFRGELYHLRKKLLAERAKHYPPEREFYRLLFIAICDYHLGANKYAVQFLDMALALDTGHQLYPLIMQIKYSVVRLARTLVVVSLEDELAYNFRRLEEIDRRIEVDIFPDYANPEDLAKRWKGFNQVFLVGHGEEASDGKDGLIVLGDLELAPGDLEDLFSDKQALPAVFGVFSCGNSFERPSTSNRIDYYLTDTFSSVPEFLEMFLAGYLTEYCRSYDIGLAFQKGKLATLFRADSNPSYVLYSRGILVQA